MYITAANIALLLLIALLICVRAAWPRFSLRVRKVLIGASIGMIVLHVLEVVTKWETASDRLNIATNWLFIAGYVLLVLLLTRLSPRWLTTMSAIVLILPLFSASILMPLATLFRPEYSRMIPIGGGRWYQVNPWTNAGAGVPGADLQVYDRPFLAPFLRYRFQSTSFNAQQCNYSAAFAVASSSPETVLVRCPHWPGQPPGSVDEILPYSKSPARLTRIP